MAGQERASGTVRVLETGDPSNQVSVGAGSTVDRIDIRGTGNRVIIGANCSLKAQIMVRTSNALVRIGERTTSQGLKITVQETAEVIIGVDCMISGNVTIYPSDTHSVIDLASGKRINPAKSIRIADHVWIGNSVMILKGSTIGTGTVIGAASVVTGEIPANVVAVGNPARVVREGVNWDRRRL